jgi:uncharacterized membrane protein YqhA
MHAFGLLDPSKIAEAKSKDGSSGMVAVYVIGIVGVIAGGAGTFFLTKFLDKFLLPIMAGVCGGLTAFMILGPMKLPSAAVIGLACLAGGVSAKFAHYVHKYIKTIGTALIGAFLFVRGIGMFELFGKYPSIFNKVQEGDEEVNVEELKAQMGKSALGYLACMIFFTGLGSFVQLKYTCVDYADDDMMKVEDS